MVLVAVVVVIVVFVVIVVIVVVVVVIVEHDELAVQTNKHQYLEGDRQVYIM